MGQSLKDWRFYILFKSYERCTIKRCASKKFDERSRCLIFQIYYFQVSPDKSDESTGFQRPSTGFQRPSPDLSGGATRLVWSENQLLETSYRLPEAFTRLVRWSHRTSPVWDRLPETFYGLPVKNSSNCSFEVGSINRPPPTLELLATQKIENTIWDPKL
jgi:hypothetical protein